jgi:hypothetical protein
MAINNLHTRRVTATLRTPRHILTINNSHRRPRLPIPHLLRIYPLRTTNTNALNLPSRSIHPTRPIVNRPIRTETVLFPPPRRHIPSQISISPFILNNTHSLVLLSDHLRPILGSLLALEASLTADTIFTDSLLRVLTAIHGITNLRKSDTRPVICLCKGHS